MNAPPTVTCTFILASANRELFVEHDCEVPAEGALVRHDDREYEVISAQPREMPPSVAGSALPEGPGGYDDFLVRIVLHEPD